jgi:hypothetical protein
MLLFCKCRTTWRPMDMFVNMRSSVCHILVCFHWQHNRGIN